MKSRLNNFLTKNQKVINHQRKTVFVEVVLKDQKYNTKMMKK